MATTEAVKQISTHLDLLFRDDAGWTYDAATQASGVPRETTRRVKKGEIRWLIDRQGAEGHHRL